MKTAGVLKKQATVMPAYASSTRRERQPGSSPSQASSCSSRIVTTAAASIWYSESWIA